MFLTICKVEFRSRQNIHVEDVYFETFLNAMIGIYLLSIQ